MLHVKLIVNYTVSFTCNIHFLNSTYYISINLKVTSFRVYFAAGDIIKRSTVKDFLQSLYKLPHYQTIEEVRHQCFTYETECVLFLGVLENFVLPMG